MQHINVEKWNDNRNINPVQNNGVNNFFFFNIDLLNALLFYVKLVPLPREAMLNVRLFISCFTWLEERERDGRIHMLEDVQNVMAGV